VLINELAQWAALLFLGVFVIGLTRQLGNFLVPSGERVALETGPDIGVPFPEQILDREDRSRILDLMTERGTSWAAVVVVAEGCGGCKGLLEGIRADGTPEDAPLIALSRNSGPEHAELLGELADVVVVDSERLGDANLLATPFGLILDDSLRVVHKQLAWDLSEVVEVWKASNGRRPPDEDPPVRREQELTLVEMGER
jgi:hypothetical protein